MAANADNSVELLTHLGGALSPIAREFGLIQPRKFA